MHHVRPLRVGAAFDASPDLPLSLSGEERAFRAKYGISRQQAEQQIRDAYPRVDPDLAAAITSSAQRLGVHPFDLANTINHESRFDPKIQPVPGASPWKSRPPLDLNAAIGLIQFLPNSARRLGTTVAALARMTGAQQMAYVEEYFRKVRDGEWEVQGKPLPPTPISTPQQLMMAVFFPPAAGWDPRKAFPAWVTGPNPTIRTVADYLSQAAHHARLPFSSPPVAAGFSTSPQESTMRPQPKTIFLGLMGAGFGALVGAVSTKKSTRGALIGAAIGAATLVGGDRVLTPPPTEV